MGPRKCKQYVDSRGGENCMVASILNFYAPSVDTYTNTGINYLWSGDPLYSIIFVDIKYLFLSHLVGEFAVRINRAASQVGECKRNYNWLSYV